MYTKLHDNVGQNSCFVDHAEGLSQLCLLARGKECSRELCPTKCNNKINFQFLSIDKFSNYKRLLNVITLVLRFFNNSNNNFKSRRKCCTKVCNNWRIQQSRTFMVSVYTTRCYENCQVPYRKMKNILDVEEDWKTSPWIMMGSIQLFYRKAVDSRN